MATLTRKYFTVLYKARILDAQRREAWDEMAVLTEELKRLRKGPQAA